MKLSDCKANVFNLFLGPNRSIVTSSVRQYIRTDLGSPQRIKALEGIMEKEMPLIDQENAWSRFAKEPDKFPKVSKNLEKLGYDDPFKFSGGIFTKMAMATCHLLPDPWFILSSLLFSVKLDSFFERLQNLGRDGKYHRAERIVRYSYLFMKLSNGLGFDTGVVTMAKIVGNRRKLDHDKIPLVPVINWIKVEDHFARFSLSHFSFIRCSIMPILGEYALYPANRLEAEEDGGRQIISYRHFMKCMSLRERNEEYLAELEAAKAYELAPWNSEYTFLCDCMSLNILRENYMDRMYTFDNYVSGAMYDDERKRFEEVLAQHPVVRIAFIEDLKRKDPNEYRRRFPEGT